MADNIKLFHNACTPETQREASATLLHDAPVPSADQQTNKDTKADAPKQNISKALLLMTSAGLLVGISSIFFKAFGKELPSLECAFFRGGVGFLVLLTLMATGLKKIPFGKRKGLLFLRGFFGSVASMLYVWAFLNMHVGLANGLNQTSPIFVCICAAIFLKERFGWWIYACVFAAFFGMTLIVSPDFSTIDSTALVAILSAIISAFAYTIIKKLQSTEQSDTIVLWFLGLSTILPLLTVPLACVIPLPFAPWHMPPTTDLLGLLAGGISSLFSQQLMTRAYRYAPATIVAPFIYISTISTLIIAYFLWDEAPTLTSLLGCGIIISCAIGIGALPKTRRAPNHR